MENESESTSAPESKNAMSPMVIAGIVVVVIVLAVAAYFMTKKSSSPSAATPPVDQSNKPVVSSAPTNAMKEGSKVEEKSEGAVKTFEVDGSNFKFSPNNLSVKEGDMVKITFKNTQGFHNFIIDEFNAKSKTIQAGQTDELSFVASKKGTFQFYCGVGNHKAMGMIGTLTVE